MHGSILYLDSSALVKLILPEEETLALFRLLLAWPYRLASQIGFVEVYRAVRRTSMDRAVLKRAEEVMATIHFLELRMDALGEAVCLEPLHLRSLDAIHVASAVTLKPEIGAFVTYDRLMADAARRLDLNVLSPA